MPYPDCFGLNMTVALRHLAVLPALLPKPPTLHPSTPHPDRILWNLLSHVTLRWESVRIP